MTYLKEKSFAGQIEQLAKLYHWRYYHTYNSAHSVAGFPDYLFLKGSEMFFAELKTEKGKLTLAQQAWVTDLIVAGQEVYIWRPSNFDAAHDRLKRPAQPRDTNQQRRATDGPRPK